MITLTGQIIEIVTKESTNPETGEIQLGHAADILHKENGTSKVTTLKIDSSVVDQWSKCVGQQMFVEVRAWALKTREGGIQAGYALTNKKSLPTVIQQKPSLKAA